MIAYPSPRVRARFFIASACLVLGSLSFTDRLAAATATETITQGTELTSTSVSSYNEGDYNTPVASEDGYVYWTFVADTGSGRVLRLMQKKPDGSVASVDYASGVAADNYHMAPSVGVDRDGHVHVAGAMHNATTWTYHYSTQAHDIATLVSKSSSLPGKGISYPAFHRDQSGVLYLTFRENVTGNNSYSAAGSTAGALLRYAPGAGGFGSWSRLGGTGYTPPSSSGTPPAVLWWFAQGPQQTRFYQGWKTRVAFGPGNRMHLTAVAYDDLCVSPDGGASHVLHVHSDDGGATFKKANGSVVQPPFNPNNADVVYASSSRHLERMAYVAGAPDGRSVLRFTDYGLTDGTNRVRQWNGGSWAEFPVATSGGVLTSDGYGIISLSRGGRFIRTHDVAATANDVYVTNTASLVDHAYLLDTGHLRYATFAAAPATSGVYTVKLSQSQDWAANLLDNSGFEAGVTSWSARYCSLGSSTDPWSGRLSGRAYNRTQTYHGLSQNVLDAVTASGAGQYETSGYVKCSAAATVQIVIRLQVAGVWKYWTYNIGAGTGWTAFNWKPTLSWASAPTAGEFYFQTTDNATADILVDRLALIKL